MSLQKEEQWMRQMMCTLVGFIAGGMLCWIYVKYPNHKTAVVCISCIAVLLVLLYGVQRRCRITYEKELLEVKNNFEKCEVGTIPFSVSEDTSWQIQGIYKSAERMRQHLRKKEILCSAALDITNSMALNLELSKLIDVIILRLIEEMDSKWGVFYIYNDQTEKLELKKAVGLSKKVYTEYDVVLGEGMIGLAAQSGKIHMYRDIAEDCIFENKTFLGNLTPKSILTVPIKSKDTLVAVLAFGSLHEINEDQLELVKLLQIPIGFSISNSLTYEKTQVMAKELKQQNSMIQSMNDEMALIMARREQ